MRMFRREMTHPLFVEESDQYDWAEPTRGGRRLLFFTMLLAGVALFMMTAFP